MQYNIVRHDMKRLACLLAATLVLAACCTQATVKTVRGLCNSKICQLGRLRTFLGGGN